MGINVINGSNSSGEDLIPVSREEILSMSPLPADFYVRLSEDHFVLVGRAGEKQMADLQALKETDKISDLYVRREEYKNCVGVNLQIAEIVVSRAELQSMQKVDILCRASESIFQEITKIGFNQESLDHSKSMARSIIALVAAKPDLNAVFDALNSVSADLVRHSVAVSAVSLMIARNLSWTQVEVNQKLALAALLHDIGMKELPADLLQKPRHLMSPTEVKAYESHVMRSVSVLHSMPNVATEVVAVALEHHENAIGQGFPRHLRDVRMHPFSRIVALADFFCELCVHGPSNPTPRTAEEALKYIEHTLGQPYSKPAFQALKMTFNSTEELRRKMTKKVA